MGNSSGNAQIDYTDKDYESLRLAMLALASRKLPEWTDHSANDPGVALLELFAYMGDLLLYYQDRIANESFLDTATERRSVVNLLRLIGCEMRPAQPASVDLTLLFKPDFNKDSPIIKISNNAEFKTAAIGGEVSFRYVRPDLDVDLRTLPSIPHDDGNTYRCYLGLPVIQVTKVCKNEIVGTSDGTSGQRFKLQGAPLITNSLKVYVNKSLWERKDTLFYSYSGDRHYMVRRDEADAAWIEFGDGCFGQIPPPIGPNNIVAYYQAGGGVKGNVPKCSVFKAVGGVAPDTDLKLVFNADAASGGMEPEDIAQAALRGPQLFRARGRAVTAEDYEAYAMDYGVAKVRARAANWNIVELYVAPAGGGRPSDTMKEDLRLYFEDKRMLSAAIEVKDPVYAKVEIKGNLYVKPQYLREFVRLDAVEALRGLLAFDQVNFAATLYISKIYEVIEAIEGVRGVTVTAFRRTEAPSASDPISGGVLYFDWNEIPTLSGIEFTATGGQSGH